MEQYHLLRIMKSCCWMVSRDYHYWVPMEINRSWNAMGKLHVHIPEEEAGTNSPHRKDKLWFVVKNRGDNMSFSTSCDLGRGRVPVSFWVTATNVVENNALGRNSVESQLVPGLLSCTSN